MNYTKHYGLLIERARKREKPDTYLERHHVVPKCMGGSDDPENLVFLTAEEHFVAHQLLVKMNAGHHGLAAAAFMMGNETNKKYGWLRRACSEISRVKAVEMWSNPNHRARVSFANTGKRATAKTKEKLSKSISSYFKSQSARDAVADRTRKQFADPGQRLKLSESVRELWSNPEYSLKLIGRKRSDESIMRIKAGMASQPPRICPHCGKEGKGGNMTRYHFENCVSRAQIC